MKLRVEFEDIRWEIPDGTTQDTSALPQGFVRDFDEAELPPEVFIDDGHEENMVDGDTLDDRVIDDVNLEEFLSDWLLNEYGLTADFVWSFNVVSWHDERECMRRM